LADFSLTQPGGAGTSIQINLLIPVLAAAGRWEIESFDNGVSEGVFFSNSASEFLGIYTVGHTVGARIAWASAANAQLSEFTGTKTIVFA
jgi:hypothetical protein